MGLKLRRLSYPLGAEVCDIDATVPVSDSQFNEIYQAFLDHCVPLFRNQEVTREQHIEFSRRFSALDRSGSFRIREHCTTGFDGGSATSPLFGPPDWCAGVAIFHPPWHDGALSVELRVRHRGKRTTPLKTLPPTKIAAISIIPMAAAGCLIPATSGQRVHRTAVRSVSCSRR